MAKLLDMDRYVVMGNPIAHSKSPRIHRLFAEQAHQQIEYTARQVELGEFAQALEAFQREGGKGANVTVPFKQDAWRCMDNCSERAKRARAVNTVVLHENGTRYGDNTDGIGLLRDLRDNNQIKIEGAAVLVLGAGGAVRGVMEPLLSQMPARMVIANRTVDKAVKLARDFADLAAISVGGFAELANQQFDIVINGTAASMAGDLPPLPGNLRVSEACCYDMMYASEATPFMRWALDHGARKVVDGLGMLVEQAAEAFLLWRKVRPDTQPVIRILREDMASA